MSKENDQLYYEYFDDWYKLFRNGKIRPVTQKKYEEAEEAIKALAPDLRLKDINRIEVQKLLVAYGKTHELATAKGFFHMVKSSLEDAKYNELIDSRDPTYKLKAISSKPHKVTRAMYLELDQAQRLEKVMTDAHTVVGDMLTFDLHTGLRFAELLGLTPADVDLTNMMINIDKTWNYKEGPFADFGETKNQSSHRKIVIDHKALNYIKPYMKNCGADEPIYVKAMSDQSHRKLKPGQKYKGIYHKTIGEQLAKFCKEAKVPRIGIHGLRHTHVCLLYNAGASLLSISKRLGHANTTTTEQVYLNLIKAKQAKDNKIMLKALDSLN